MILAVLVLILAVLLFGSSVVTSFFGAIAGTIAFCFAVAMFATATGFTIWGSLFAMLAGAVGIFLVVGLPLMLVYDAYERKKYGLPKRKSMWS